MGDVTGPITIDLSKEDIDNLKDGETVTRELDTDIDGTTELEIEWHTVYESEGAAELFEEIQEAFE